MTDWITNIARLSAVADRSADEGYLNLNKLLEAGIYSQIKRAAWNYQPKVTRQTLPAELKTSLSFLAEHNSDQDLLAVIEKGYQGIIDQRASDFLVSEAPDVFVCRTCGYLSFSRPPDHCPDCGSWPGRFRKFVAVFNMDNFEPINPMGVIQLFAKNADDLASLVNGLSEDVLAKKPGEDEWSLRDHIAHFYDAQEMLDTRLDLMIKHEDPELEAMAIYENAAEGQGRAASTHDMLEQFLAHRRQSIATLEGLPLKDLWRTGCHSEFGRITIIRQVAYLAYHEQTHLPEIEDLRQQFF